jgi:hypothetical protein
MPPEPSSYEDRLIICYPNTIRKCFDLKIPSRKFQSKNTVIDDEDDGDMDIDAEKGQNRKQQVEKILEEATDFALLQSLQTEILPPSKSVQTLPWQHQQQLTHFDVNTTTSDDNSGTGINGPSSSCSVKPTTKSKSRRSTSSKKISQEENDAEDESKSAAPKAHHGRNAKPIKALVMQLVAQQVLPNLRWAVKQSGTLQGFNYDICDSILTALYAHHAHKYVTDEQNPYYVERVIINGSEFTYIFFLLFYCREKILLQDENLLAEFREAYYGPATPLLTIRESLALETLSSSLPSSLSSSSSSSTKASQRKRERAESKRVAKMQKDEADREAAAEGEVRERLANFLEELRPSFLLPLQPNPQLQRWVNYALLPPK